MCVSLFVCLPTYLQSMYIYQIKSTHSKGNITLVIRHVHIYTHVCTHLYAQSAVRQERFHLLALLDWTWAFKGHLVLWTPLGSFLEHLLLCLLGKKYLREASYLKFKCLKLVVKHPGVRVRWTLVHSSTPPLAFMSLGKLRDLTGALSVKGGFRQLPFKVLRAR